MLKGNFERLVLRVRLDAKQKALQQGLLVPWPRLAESASAYTEWHIFILWVRAIAEVEEQLPDMVVASLEDRCPGFLDDEIRQQRESRREQRFLWHSLEEWIAAHHFTKPKTDGWFDAVMYYAYTDLRTEKAWSFWERTKDTWMHTRPSRWPTLEEWTAEVLSADTLTRAGTDKARAVAALARVDPDRLRRAVSELLDSRAFALWLACVYQPKQALAEPALNELRRRCPDLQSASYSNPIWGETLFFRLVRFEEAEWRAAARAEKWYPALRYHLVHHPRYHRLIHYNRRCRDEWLHVRPISYPSFSDWLHAADAYFVAPNT